MSLAHQVSYLKYSDLGRDGAHPRLNILAMHRPIDAVLSRSFAAEFLRFLSLCPTKIGRGVCDHKDFLCLINFMKIRSENLVRDGALAPSVIACVGPFERVHAFLRF